jgi:hypothetical protein
MPAVSLRMAWSMTPRAAASAEALQFFRRSAETSWFGVLLPFHA